MMRFWSLPHLGLRFIVVISLISCSSKKEKLGSNTPINFITSFRFSSEVGSVAASLDSADSPKSDSLNWWTREERIKMLEGAVCGQNSENMNKDRPSPSPAPPAARYESTGTRGASLPWSPSLQLGSLTWLCCCFDLRTHKMKHCRGRL